MSNQLITPNGIVDVRPAVPADAVAVRELRLEALSHHPEAFAADHASTATGLDDEWVDLVDRYANNQGILCIASFEERLTGIVRALEHGGTLHWRYRGTPYEKVIDPEGVTTEFVRCLDPTASGIVIKVTRTALPD